MSWFDCAFWGCIALVLYPYLAYPLCLALLARLRARPVRRGVFQPRGVSVVICAHNEQHNIERRLVEFVDLLARASYPGEILVVTDGSTDGTADVVRRHAVDGVRLIELPRRAGKAAALSEGVSQARYDILVFGDVRQTWAPDALLRLLENFADPEVGAVSGDLVVSARPGAMEGVGLYWRYEKWLRRNESAIGSQVGVTGAICACRQELFRPIPAGTLLDDVYWPMQVAMTGRRVVHDSRALAFDRLPDRASDEFRRKVRTLAGNYQLAAWLPRSLVPGLNPIWLQFLSHKLARLMVPWALLGLLVLSLLGEGWWYQAALMAQVGCYLLGLVGLGSRRGGKLVAAAGSFLVLNTAAWVAFWVWISGRAGSTWTRVSYDGRKSRSGSSVPAHPVTNECSPVLARAATPASTILEGTDLARPGG
ncbi:MAG: glycosyltransferase family 2 protein [Gemmataceae bacterium]